MKSTGVVLDLLLQNDIPLIGRDDEIKNLTHGMGLGWVWKNQVLEQFYRFL